MFKSRRKIKTNKNIIFIIVVFLLIMIIGFFSVKNIKQITISKNDLNKLIKYNSGDINDDIPEFYGTTNITIKVNDEFNLKDSMYRILAKDKLDGNITKNIVIVSNNVNTAIQGNYEIKYEVINSRNKKATITVPVQVIENGERKIQRTLYVLPNLSYLNDSEFKRGNEQDAQNLGIYIPANKTAEIRQINSNLNQDLYVSFYNGDCLKEADLSKWVYNLPKEYNDYRVKTNDKRIIIKSMNEEYVELKNETETVKKLKTESTNNYKIWEEYSGKSYDSIPIVKTLSGIEEKPVLEIVINEDVKNLDYFTYGDNDEEFKNKWGESKNEYAILDGDRVQFIVPYKDLETLGVNKKTTGDTTDHYRHDKFENIDDILSYYDNLIETYDRLVGLSYDAEEVYNKNVKTKFLIKVDKHGRGTAAYASWNYISISDRNGDTLESLLHNTDGGWIQLHEIGHGYQGVLKNKELDLGEISNNFFAYYFQQNELKPDDEMLKNFTDEECEKTIQLVRETEQSYLKNESKPEVKNGVNAYNIIFFPYINLLNKIGYEEALSYTYKYVRQLVYEGKINEIAATDIIAKGFSEGTGYNVIPYLEDWKLNISDDVKKEIYEKNYPIVYYLNDIVEENLEEIKNELGLRWNYSLVTNNDIKKYNKVRSLKINIIANKIKDSLWTSKILLKSGDEIVRQINIDQTTIDISDIPIGIYEIEIDSEKYFSNQKSIVISEDSTQEKNIEIILREIEYIDVFKEQDKKQYVEGQNFDPEGMIVKAYFNDGTNENIYEYIIENGENIQVDDISVKIYYYDEENNKFSTNALFFVKKKKLIDTIITKVPDKLIYIEGEDFDPKGMIITLYYNDGTEEEITKYTVKDGNNLTLGQTSITISYTENGVTKTIKQAITVSKEETPPIIVKNYEIKQEGEKVYILGISSNTTIEKFIENIESNVETEIVDKNDNLVESNSLIATGMKIKAGEEEYILIVKADLNSDGKIDITDLSIIARCVVGKVKINKPYELAGDINKDGKIDITDLSIIATVITKKIKF